MPIPGEVVIVGAGLAGLCCARRLHQCHTPFRVLEASDAVGGRVRTDVVDGFRLDRGFQVYLTAYEEGRRVLDYPSLEFRPFESGAVVWRGGRFHALADPRRRPLAGLGSLFAGVGTLADKFRVALLAARLRAGPAERLWKARESTTLEYLREDVGLSAGMIDGFFRPFFGGVCLDRGLTVSSRFFRFVFRTLAKGDAVVPAAGMSAIPEQIAAGLPAGSVRLNAAVEAVAADRVTLRGGEVLPARAVVVAAEGPAAARLLGGPPPKPGRAATTLYFAATEGPLRRPVLALDGDGTGPVNHLAEVSAAAPSYAPAGQALIAANVLGDPAEDDRTLEGRVRDQLAGWFGPGVHTWRHLRTYRVAHAHPDQTPPALGEPRRPVRVRPGVYVCGDHRDNASIDGAMTSGWRAAQALLDDLAAASPA